MIKFVTGLYNWMHNTKMNGRNGREFYYMFSLRSLASMKSEIICYTTNKEIEFMSEFLEQQKDAMTNVKFVDSPLTNYRHHSRVMEIKDLVPTYYTEPSWMDRNIEIMWGKFDWMEEQMQSMGDDDYMFWVDVGISHGGIFPNRLNPYFDNPDFFIKRPELGDVVNDNSIHSKFQYKFRFERIFNENFPKKLQEYAGDKLVLVAGNHPQHNDAWPLEFHTKVHLYPIGGIFGGKKKVLMPFIREFRKISEYLLNEGYLVKEEQIMHYLINVDEDFDKYKIFNFQTWYHDDWGDEWKTWIKFCDFFETVMK
jgi:hypothetical protein